MGKLRAPGLIVLSLALAVLLPSAIVAPSKAWAQGGGGGQQGGSQSPGGSSQSGGSQQSGQQPGSGQAPSGQGAGQPPAQADPNAPPPPPWTQEKQVPKEVKDHEKERPAAACGTGYIYVNDKTGESVEIEYKVKKNGHVQWTITRRLNGQQTITKYDIDPTNPANNTKTVKTATGSTTGPIGSDDFVQQTPTTQTATPGAGAQPTTPPTQTPSGQGTTPTQGGSGGSGTGTKEKAPAPSSTPKDSTPAPSTQGRAPQPPTEPQPTTTSPPPTTTTEVTATTQERIPTNVPTTQPRVIIVKVVTEGGPPPETTIGFDPGTPTTPTQITQIPQQPQTPGTFTGGGTPFWGPDDPEGPRTGIPLQPGQPGQPPIDGGGQTIQPGGGGFIYVGFGWATSAPIPTDFINSCTETTEEATSDGFGTSPEAQREQLKAMAQALDKASGATPMTQVRDCAEIDAKLKALLKELEAAHDSNRRHAQAAQKAFWGDPANPNVDGYMALFNRADVTRAQVEGANAAGKALIDAALFAVGYGGFFGEGTAGQAIFDGLFGSGLRGAKSVGEVYTKIAQKALSKVLDAEVGGKIGSGAAASWKSVEMVVKGKDTLWQPTTGFIESAIRGKVIDAVGDWMKEGAASADTQGAAKAYADFMANAESGNVDAAMGELLIQQLQKTNEEAKANNCPTVEIPDYSFTKFDTAPFGMGSYTGEKGPAMTLYQPKTGDVVRSWDMFARNSAP